MGLGIYIFLGLFVCDGGLMAISNRERRWTDLVWGFTKREGRLIWFGGRWTELGVHTHHLGGSEGHL